MSDEFVRPDGGPREDVSFLRSSHEKETMATRRYVRESGDGWEVLREGDRRTAVQSESRKKAIARARDIVRKQGGGEIRVLNRAGKIIGSSKVSKHSGKRP
jgi:Uncharacterized protein conserved in bacteria (DUF2188)